MLCFETGERYSKKEETIKKWMGRDRAKDELLENTVSPDNIYCNKCGEAMFVESKTLHSRNIKEKERVLFIFRCPSKCEKGRAVFSEGEAWIMVPEVGSKMRVELDKRAERKDDKILTHYNCKECGFKKVEEYDFSIKKEQGKIDKFYNCDRARFCLNEKQGQEYYKGKQNLERSEKLMRGIEEREKNKDLYEKVSKLKKLTIVELEKILIPVLKKDGYIKFELGKPEIGRDVFVEFSTQDKKSDREEYDSNNNLKKTIKKTLENTNWRLMSEGIHYRLGFLSGRLRGYEKEGDLVKLINNK